ncbi:hypothetical protein DFJ73DRAFT_836355 [Zopfochytrium polystomum]|nr:hypothetical protein DFJ73DRAFT_836355 [Zopfochytrium polystomum]
MEGLVSGGADCGPSNSLSSFAKHIAGDRSHDQDRFVGGGQNWEFGGPRSRRAELEDAGLADEFFREQAQGGPSQLRQQRNPFEFRDFRSELGVINLVPAVKEGWAEEFARQPSLLLNEKGKEAEFAEFDAAFAHHREALGQAQGWSDEFATFAEAQKHHEPRIVEENAEFDRAFQQAKENAQWEEEFARHEVSWADEFKAEQSWADEFQAEQDADVNITGSPKEALAKTAGLLLDVVENSANPKFKASKFMDFMKQLRDQQLVIEGNKVVEPVKEAQPQDAAANWAAEFGATVSGGSWEEEFQIGPDEAPGITWSDEFYSQRTQSVPQDPKQASDRENEAALEEAFNEYYGEGRAYHPPTKQQVEPAFLNWEDEFRAREETNRPSGYNFVANNPYINRSMEFLTNVAAHRDLAESILALEAVVQAQPQNAQAWSDLGFKQQENENEKAAIVALEQVLALDPGSLKSWLGLAVSYTNEGRQQEAHTALDSWIRNHPTYGIVATSAGTIPTHDELVRYYLAAARMRAGHDLDPDVQLGLGVIFHLNHEFEKAIDCFEASLSKSPQDYMLWNKLGATLANSGQYARAMDAYKNAIAINPSYVRARYNSSIAMMQLGSYGEAAGYLLGALSLQQSNPNTVLVGDASVQSQTFGMQSDALWDSLRSILVSYMGRFDLAAAADERDLGAFRDEFKFL